MTKRISFVVTVVAVTLALAACGRGPGTGGTDTNGDGTTPPTPTTPTPSHVGEWYFAPNVKVTLTEDAFMIVAGDGMAPLGTEAPFDAVTKIAVSGDLEVMDSTYTLSVKPESLEIDYVDPTQEALLTPFILGAIKTAAESGPATVEDINAMHDPPTMTVVARFIAPLFGLPYDARLRACLDMP